MLTLRTYQFWEQFGLVLAAYYTMQKLDAGFTSGVVLGLGCYFFGDFLDFVEYRDAPMLYRKWLERARLRGSIAALGSVWALIIGAAVTVTMGG